MTTTTFSQVSFRRPGVSFADRLAAGFASLRERAARRARLRREANELAAMTGRDLQDIGITPADVARVVASANRGWL